MKTRETTPGKTYSVHTASGCTVSDKNGWSKTIDAPDGYFTAHAGEVTIDGDDAADVREVFKLAPYQKLRLLGVVGGNVPAWYAPLKAELTALLDGSKFELAWLAGKKTLVVHTDRVDDDLLERVRATAEAYLPAGVELAQYNHNMEISWRDINKYAECVTVEDMLAVETDYKNDLTSDGEWIYPLPNLKNGKNLFQRANIKKINQIFPSLTAGDLCISWCDKMSEAVLSFPALKSAFRLIYDSDIQVLRLSIPKTLTSIKTAFPYNFDMKEFYCDFSHVTDAREAFMEYHKLEVLDTDWSALSSASMMFDGSRLPKNIILRVLNTIPSYTSGSHPLTLGIHVDHQTDDEVLAAIANAEAKGWTLTVQWNGTPTAQGASTFAMGSLIYARVGEHELPDGTVERHLDWGHYVTDTTGYEEFRSVNSAREYFGLPAEDLTNN